MSAGIHRPISSNWSEHFNIWCWSSTSFEILRIIENAYFDCKTLLWRLCLVSYDSNGFGQLPLWLVLFEETFGFDRIFGVKRERSFQMKYSIEKWIFVESKIDCFKLESPTLTIHFKLLTCTAHLGHCNLYAFWKRFGKKWVWCITNFDRTDIFCLRIADISFADKSYPVTTHSSR